MAEREADLLAERVAAAASRTASTQPGTSCVLLRSGTDVRPVRAGAPARPASRRTGRSAAATTAASRSPTCAPTCGWCAAATTTTRCSRCSPRRSSASPTTGCYACAGPRKTASSGALEYGLPDGLAERDRGLLRAFRQRFDRLVAASRRGRPRGAAASGSSRTTTTTSPAWPSPTGKRRYANVRKLIRLAREYETLRGPDLAGFLHFVGTRRRAARGVRGRHRRGGAATPCA